MYCIVTVEHAEPSRGPSSEVLLVLAQLTVVFIEWMQLVAARASSVVTAWQSSSRGQGPVSIRFKKMTKGK